MPDSLVTAFTLRQHLLDLLLGETTLLEFDEWFALQTWDDSNVALDTRELAAEVELVLAEYTGGHWTWAEVRSHLQDLAQRVAFSWGASAVISTGSVAGEVIRAAAPALRSDAANIQYAAVCV